MILSGNILSVSHSIPLGYRPARKEAFSNNLLCCDFVISLGVKAENNCVLNSPGKKRKITMPTVPTVPKSLMARPVAGTVPFFISVPFYFSVPLIRLTGIDGTVTVQIIKITVPV